ncbi:MAG: 50S ribosomal protein L6 [uncultured bacterium]|jgi:large subunit ribosomal protein L6|nr:MAG: 50S ribosomal protein L6 [uncultured bacterium]KKP29591.1 MAG: 50S ribosomal protein L6 [candidate division TM6 bacterium GW2011_GWF2_30_66]
MSKIGRKPISLGGVKIEIKGGEISYKGAKASGTYLLPDKLEVELKENNLFIKPTSSAVKDREINRIWGLHRALLANKLKGSDVGFENQLKINGLGYKAVVAGKNVVFSIGFSHKVEIVLPEGVNLEVDKTGQLLTFKSYDKELIGAICSKIRAIRPPEPYKGTGIKWAAEVILRKAGKAKSA